MSPARPTWQTDQCPRWCVSVHREDDLPADRFHDSVGTYIPATVLDPETREPGPTELLLAIFRQCGTDDDWLHLGTPDDDTVRLTLSVESARLLGRNLVARTSADALG